MSDDSALGSSSVPHGDAPGDDAREQATTMVVKRGDDPIRVRISAGDADGDQWIAAHADATVEVADQR